MRAYVERVTHDHLGGWACNDRALSDRLKMTLILDGRPIATTRAENYREDLRRNGLGDGRYGYVFSGTGIEDLPAAYLAGRLEVRADLGYESLCAKPAAYLHRQVEELVQCRALETNSFGTFLSGIPSADSVDPKSAAYWSDLMDVSRAHYPNWRTSTIFLDLAKSLANKAGKPACEHFYAQELAADHKSDGGDAPIEPQCAPETYGTMCDLVNGALDLPVNVVEPKFFSGGSTKSFLGEIGILKSDEGSAGAVKVLAFREYTFGAPTWWAIREGVRKPAPRMLYYLDFELLRTVLDEGGFLLIDMSNEGPSAHSDWMAVLNAAIFELRIPPRQIILVTQNLRFTAYPSEQRFVGHVAYAHYFIGKALLLLKEKFPTEQTIARHCSMILSGRRGTPDPSLKHYICLNFTPRWPRWATVLHLSSKNLLERGHVSFPGESNFKLQGAMDLENSIPGIRRRRELLAHIPELLRKCPLELDIPRSARSSPDFEFPLELMMTSLMHIVTETEITNGLHCMRITEKTIKPIIGLQPFLIIGNPGSLTLLHKMGFRTFNPHVDESYDLIADPARRLDAIFDEIDRLLGLPLTTLRAMVEDLNDTLIHNFMHLMLMGPMIFNASAAWRLKQLICSQSPGPTDSSGDSSNYGAANRLPLYCRTDKRITS